MAIDNYRSSAT